MLVAKIQSEAGWLCNFRWPRSRVCGMIDPETYDVDAAVEDLRNNPDSRWDVDKLLNNIRRLPILTEEEVNNFHHKGQLGKPTLKEVSILQDMADGYDVDEILVKRNITYHTFRVHVRNVKYKFGIHTQAGAVAIAFRKGLVV
jgi:DNA-binding CsgD family transcriptional regulator